MQQTPKRLSRRDALKVLGAAAGATALANLPARWVSPVVNAGVLPAHAQGSCQGFGLTFETTGALYVDLTFTVDVGPAPDSITGTGYPATWTWNAAHCDCLVFHLSVFEPPDWTTENSGGDGPSGSMFGGATLWVGTNFLNGLIVANQDFNTFAALFNTIGCPFEIG